MVSLAFLFTVLELHLNLKYAVYDDMSRSRKLNLWSLQDKVIEKRLGDYETIVHQTFTQVKPNMALLNV